MNVEVTSNSTPNNLYMNMLISLVIASIIGGAVVTLRKAKKQTQKAQVIKTSEVKKQIKAKILEGADEEQNTFTVEEKYERVAWWTTSHK